MKKIAALFIFLSILLTLVSCLTTGTTSGVVDQPEVEPVPTSTPVPAQEVTIDSFDTTEDTEADPIVSSNGSSGDSEELEKDFETIEGMYEDAKKSINYGRIAEGIERYITTIAFYKTLDATSSKIDDIKEKAQLALARIETSLVLEPGPDWFDAAEQQITGSSIDLGKENTMMPVARLSLLDEGGGRSIVSDAPVRFAFEKGAGTLTKIALTNDFGLATCIVAQVENSNQEHIIKAFVEFEVKGQKYTFSNAKTTFVYMPPANTVTILGAERYEITGEFTDNPGVINDVYNVVRDLPADFTEYNGILLGDDFINLFNGNKDSIKAVAQETGVSYLLIAFSDCYSNKQLELNGKIYDIFKSLSKATAKIIRVNDGRILYTTDVEGISGQGNNEEKALRNGLQKVREALAEKIQEEISQIEAILAGSEE